MSKDMEEYNAWVRRCFGPEWVVTEEEYERASARARERVFVLEEESDDTD